jgi:hypothetical protein
VPGAPDATGRRAPLASATCVRVAELDLPVAVGSSVASRQQEAPTTQIDQQLIDGGKLVFTPEFRYVLHEAGFHSENVVPRRGGLRVNGGFTVEAHADGCRIWHYERYLLPRVAAPLKPAVAAYVRWTQRREMRDLAALIGP